MIKQCVINELSATKDDNICVYDGIRTNGRTDATTNHDGRACEFGEDCGLISSRREDPRRQRMHACMYVCMYVGTAHDVAVSQRQSTHGGQPGVGACLGSRLPRTLRSPLRGKPNHQSACIHPPIMHSLIHSPLAPRPIKIAVLAASPQDSLTDLLPVYSCTSIVKR
eukprot:GHVU01077212.1.p1 GENE.GHVU01077212.1~~GHVU01077212.1.p1  ORF type:complete len:167 (+),score=2.83 GHVU01077212.1:1666-2166(+)